MNSERCPFYEIKTVTFCKASPFKKMIPVDKSSAVKSRCNTINFEECSVYKEISNPEREIENIRGFLLKYNYYFHPGHAWISLLADDGKESRVGIDDFSQKLIGRIDKISFPSEGSTVKENSLCFLVNSGRRSARIVAPADGVIKEINQEVLSVPRRINLDPYNLGWIFSMHLTGDGIKGLFYGSNARKWLEYDIRRLHSIFASDLENTATDGGESVEDICSMLTDAQWSRIINLFLG